MYLACKEDYDIDLSSTEQDSHPTYKRLLGSMQLVNLLRKVKADLTETETFFRSILNNVSDSLRQEHIRTMKRNFFNKRKKPKQTKATLPPRKSAPSSRKDSTQSRTSADKLGDDIFLAMGQTVNQAQGGPIQRPMVSNFCYPYFLFYPEHILFRSVLRTVS